MKKIFISFLLFIGLISIPRSLKADVCLGTTVTYPYEQGVGWYKIYTNAKNADGSTAPSYYTGPGNHDLVVTWTGAGQGTLYFYERAIDGSEYNVFMYVNVLNCLGMVSIPTALCNGNSQSFTLTDTMGSTSYTWTAPSGWSLNGGSNTLTTSSTSVTVTVANPATAGFNPITVSSNNSGARTFNVWIGSPVFNCI